MLTGKTIGTGKFLRKKFFEYEFEGKWKASFGMPEKGSRWLIYGDSGSGKTEFAVQLAKYMTRFGKVFFLSREQGDSSSLQQCWKRNNMREVKSKIVLGVGYNMQELIVHLQAKRKIETVIIDSIDYMDMTAEEYKQLSEICNRKNIILVSWKEGKRPKSAAGRAIEYMVSVKIEVRDFVAFPRSRYGGNQPYIIWLEKAKDYHAFANVIEV
ncbi:MAG: ATP-binding protein [Chitinophagaceae bacterium]